MFTIEHVSNLEWCNEEKTTLRCMVKYSQFDEVLPVGVNATDPSPHIRELWLNANAGEYGDIAPYIVPSEPLAVAEDQPQQQGAETF